MPQNNPRPALISAGSFFFAVAILVAGMLATWSLTDAGLKGLRAYWPVIAACLAAIVVNVIAICSPGGSIFALADDVIAELRRRTDRR